MLFAEFNVQPEKCMSGALNTNTPNRIRGVYFPSLTKSSILPPRDLKKAASGERSIRFGAAFVMRRSSGRTGSVTKSLDQETATDMSHASPSEGNSNVCGLFGWEAGKNHAFNGVSITSLNVNLLTRAQKALSGLRRRGFRGYCALKGAFFRLKVEGSRPKDRPSTAPGVAP